MSTQPLRQTNSSAVPSGAVVGSPARKRRRAPITTLFFILLVTFVIAFPKGGIKVGDVPVTIGYVILAIAAGLSYFRFILNLKNIPRRAFHAWLLTLPFQLVFILTYLNKGAGSTAILLANFTCFIFMPNAFLILFAPSARLIDPQTIIKFVVLAIRFICIFGIIVFFTKTISGYTVEVPFLTVNLDDIGALESKNNTRHGIYKLISTYNNGNIFGVCLAMMLPVYYFIEKKKIFFIIAAACMMLTLSRTAWVSLVLCLMAIAWVDAQRPSRIIALGGLGLLCIAMLPLILQAIGRDTSFLFDSKLGGREPLFEVFKVFSVIPQDSVGVISEVAYASIYRIYGLIGLLAFFLFLLAPIIVTLVGPLRKRIFNRAAVAGLSVYMVAAWSDGATLLIPTMAIYFFLALLALEIDVNVEREELSISRPSFAGKTRAARGYYDATPTGTDDGKPHTHRARSRPYPLQSAPIAHRPDGRSIEGGIE